MAQRTTIVHTETKPGAYPQQASMPGPNPPMHPGFPHPPVPHPWPGMPPAYPPPATNTAQVPVSYPAAPNTSGYPMPAPPPHYPPPVMLPQPVKTVTVTQTNTTVTERHPPPPRGRSLVGDVVHAGLRGIFGGPHRP